MLRKHLSQYSDDELRTEVARHVDEKVPESKRLDYKQVPSLDTRKGKREAAKDISSFANEIGGYLVYGIPEERRALPDGTKTAIPKKPYGIDPVAGLEGRLEDIYVEAICPALPDLQIRKVETEYEGKVVYVVWHPETWMGPHMVQAYGDNSYYRRGLLRAVKMDEHEVRDRYTRTQTLVDRTEKFMESPEVNFYTTLTAGSKTHFLCCPLMLVPDRVDFSSDDMRSWLRDNRAPEPGSYSWRPSYHGVCASLALSDESSGFKPYWELHRNGAISYFRDTRVAAAGEEVPWVLIAYVLTGVETFLEFCSGFYEHAQYYGPLAIRLTVTRPFGSGFAFPNGRNYSVQSPSTQYAVPGDVLQLSRVIPGAQLVEHPRKVLRLLADLLYQTFHQQEADCFDEDLNLKWTVRW